MLRDQGKGEEVDRIMNEIQGGYVEEVAKHLHHLHQK